jgi:hypothetical protein
MAKNGLAWVVAVDMGLGHQRAIDPLKDIAYGGLINMQDPAWMCKKEAGVWHTTRTLYESVSRAGRIPLIGRALMAIMLKIQAIPPFYPKKDQSAPTGAVRYLDRKIRKRDMGKRLVGKMGRHPLPLVTSFYAVAIAAEKQGYKGDIYCIICDSDFNRAWLPLDPQASRIRYFSPCTTVSERLALCGVAKGQIFTTGFPLPLENTGKGESLSVLKRDMAERLVRLDPSGAYRRLERRSIHHYLGEKLHKAGKGPGWFTVTFAVGGAGAQVEIGLAALASLAPLIRENRVRLNLVAALRPAVEQVFRKAVAAAGLADHAGVRIVFEKTMAAYMKTFNSVLRTTDVLWTKPSELTFYAALGVAMVAAPPIGVHEERNFAWLEQHGAVVPQQDPRYAHQWLPDLCRRGILADKAMSGFLKLRKLGARRIKQVLRGQHPVDADDLFSR